MPSSLQEWIALGIVALTVGYLLGRWLAKRRQASGAKSSDCNDCPQAAPAEQTFKNIPINVTQKSDISDK
ncbi:MAG: hypothetical protein OXT49_05595 [Gammaproteobacteria bacterium]|nr:hypothetical protein [Gammaproteobacteria bacterium]